MYLIFAVLVILGGSVNPNIAIVGGGPAGLVFAISLARRGVSSVIFEALENPIHIKKYTPSRSYAIDMTGHGLKAVRYIDALDEFNNALIPFDGMQLNGRKVSSWDEPGWIGSRGDILSVLTEIAINQYSDLINIRFECQLEDIDVHKGTMNIRQSGVDDVEHCGPYDLIVAADGGGSKIREQAIEQEPAYNLSREDIGYYFKMLTMDKNTEALNHNHLQIFAKTRMMVAGAINGPKGKDDPMWFSAVPYPNAHVYETPAAAKKSLKKHCPGVLKYCSDEAVAEFSKVPAQNIGRITSSSQLFAGKVVFLGDAAISYPPIGQGINGAMESATVLDLALIRHTTNETDVNTAIKKTLEDYNTTWLPETKAVAWMGRKTNQANFWHVIRSVLLNLVGLSHMDLVKSSTMSYSEAERRTKKLGPVWWG